MTLLCQKAPQGAELLGTTILQCVGTSDPDTTEEPNSQSQASGRTIAQLRKRKLKDNSYRPPKQVKTTKAPKVSRHSARPAASRTREVEDNSNTAGSTAQGTHVDSTTVELIEASTSGEAALVPLEDPDTLEGANEAGSEADGCMATCNLESNVIASLTEGRTVPTDSREQIESAELRRPSSPVQSTPIHQSAAPSPQTEEVYRARIPESPESIRSSPRMTDAVAENGLTVMDHILEVIPVIHSLSKHRGGLPREVHVTILQALRDSRLGTLASIDWTSGSMWVDILEAGSAEGQKVTIWRMLEYMGAWEWYDAQVRSLQESGTIHTKKNKPVNRKGAATHVLNQIQQSGECIKSLGRLTVDNNGTDRTISNDLDTMTERIGEKQRRRIVKQLSRGQRLSTRLVKELGLGILFSPKIW